MTRETGLTNGMRKRFLSIAAAAAAVLAGTGSAHAQFVIVNPNLLPDLSVSVSAPDSGDIFHDFAVTATVAASAPLYPVLRVGSIDASLILDLVGYQALWISADPALSCQIFQRAPDWAQVMCSASLVWGTSASVLVSVLPAVGNGNGVGISGGLLVCRPGYADAAATPSSGGDRNLANNRSIARTTLAGCIP